LEEQMAGDDRVVPIPKAASDEVRTDELVEVFDTEDEVEAMVIKGLLESEGIAALVSSLDAPQTVYPGVGGVIVRVRGDQAQEAARIIAENRIAENRGAAPDQGPSESGPNEAA
jgi:hypothetical protein